MSKYDVLCIGNAIVDILAKVDDSFLEKHDTTKGAMILIDEQTSDKLYNDMPPATEKSGGSAGNTAAGISMLGGNVAYIGKIKDDQLGKVFTHDMRSIGVSFDTKAAVQGDATATSMILVTPDAQRTMNTFLGACANLSVEDIDNELVKSSGVIYVEGYLWDKDHAKEAVKHAMKIAKEAGNKVALSLSDSFCVDRFREEFQDLVENQVDILFANEDELKSLYQMDDFDAALDVLSQKVEIAAVTRGASGAVATKGTDRFVVEAYSADVVDTTGAGDLFAAGFLYGLTSHGDLKKSCQTGCVSASEVISQIGARLESDLKAKVDSLI